MHKAFVSPRHQRAEHWMQSAIDLAVVLLEHRRAMSVKLSPTQFAIYESVSRELVSRTIWKYSEAWGKFVGNAFWSQRALEHFDHPDRRSEALFRHEHVFPQIKLIEILRRLTDPNPSDVRKLYEKYAVAAVILKDEDALLSSAGWRQRTVDGAEANPWLRYSLGAKQILIVEHDAIPKWHLEKLRDANLLACLAPPPRVSRIPEMIQSTTAALDARRSSAVKGKRYYFDGSFPPPETKVRFLVTENPKIPGSASRERFERYWKANPTTVRDLLNAGATHADVRYDIAHNFIGLEPDPRNPNSST